MILITGASGRIGRRTAGLLTAGGQSLRLMTRSREEPPKIDGAETVQGDFADPSTLGRAFEGVEVAFVISGSAKPGERALHHHNAFQAAARARVQHVTYLSLQGAGPDSKYPYNRDHYMSEQFLAETGLPFTVLRDSFYIDMFVNKFDDEDVVRGPAGDGRGAFVSREDVARTAAAVLQRPPGGIHDVTGPEALSVAEVANRLATLVNRPLRFEPETADATRERLLKSGMESWRVDLEVGWFEAIAAGELERTSDAVRGFTGKDPLPLEEYFRLFPKAIEPLRR